MFDMRRRVAIRIPHCAGIARYQTRGRSSVVPTLLPLIPNPYSLIPIPYSLIPIPYSLRPAGL